MAGSSKRLVTVGSSDAESMLACAEGQKGGGFQTGARTLGQRRFTRVLLTRWSERFQEDGGTAESSNSENPFTVSVSSRKRPSVSISYF